MHPDALITFLPSSDLVRSADFYERVLGLEVVLVQAHCRIYRLTDESYIGVCERNTFEEHPVITTIVADDVDGWYAKIAATGWEDLTEPVHNDAYLITHIWVTDPDGNKIEVQRFDDPDWASTS